jgi:hypothetical protein
MNKLPPTLALYGRCTLLVLLALGLGGLLGGHQGMHTAQAQSTMMCVVGAGETCGTGPPHVVALLGDPLTLDIRVEDFVDADDDGDTLPEGLGVFQFRIDYDPDVVSVSGVSDQAEVQALFLGSSGRSVTCVEPILATSFVQWACGTLYPTPLGPTGSGVVARVTFQPGAQGDVSTELTLSTILADLQGNPQPHADQGATVTVLDPLGDTDGDGLSNGDELTVYGTDPLNPDTDGDGCADSEDLALGFDPLDPWDVYDVPVPAKCDVSTGCPSGSPVGANGTKNNVVNMQDVMAVLFYGFTQRSGACGDNPNTNRVDYDCDKGVDTNGDTVADIPPDGVADGLAYDRTVSAEPNPPWDAGPPNGVVNMIDVGAAMAQVFVVNCSGPP